MASSNENYSESNKIVDGVSLETQSSYESAPNKDLEESPESSDGADRHPDPDDQVTNLDRDDHAIGHDQYDKMIDPDKVEEVTDPDQDDQMRDLDQDAQGKISATDSFIVEFGSSPKSSLQDAFLKYRRKRQRELKKVKRKRKDVPNEARLRAMADPERMWQLRMKFLEQAKKYFGVPYAKKYWKPEDPEYNSKLFLDCCGLVRRVMRDLRKDFGFLIGPWNQAYMCDTLPITIEKEEDMKPGDLVFISGTYYNTKMKKQKHNMTHVEIWLGEGQKTIGARWHKGKVQVFDSYQFESTSYHSMKYIFKSIDTWLMGICRSHCPEHAWKTRAQRFVPSKKSIFALPVQQTNGDSDESAGDCSGEEAGQLSGKQYQKECGKKTSESTTVKKVKKSKRSSKSAQPRLIGTSQTPRLSEKVRLPLSADSKRTLMKSRAQQQQLVLRSLGVQGKSFGQQRQQGHHQNIRSKPSMTKGTGECSSPVVDLHTSMANRDRTKSSCFTHSDKNGSELPVCDDVSTAISGVHNMTLHEMPQSKSSSMTLAQQKYSKQDTVQLFTLSAAHPMTANFLPPINQMNRRAMATQFDCQNHPRPTPSESISSAWTASFQCLSDDSAQSSFTGAELLDITESDSLAEAETTSDFMPNELIDNDIVAEEQTESHHIDDIQTSRFPNKDGNTDWLGQSSTDQ